MPGELPEDVVGQGKNQKNATGEGIKGEDIGWRGENVKEGQQGNSGKADIQQKPGERAGAPAGQPQKRRRGAGGQQPDDPNREPGDQTLYNEDKQGNVFYDKNTEIKRETEFHDATAAPLGNEQQKVNQQNDEFGKKK